MRFILLVLVGLLFSSGLQAQMKSGDQKKFDKAKQKRNAKDFETALKLLTDLVADYPENIELHIEKGTTHLMDQNENKAIESFEQAIELDPKHSFRLWFTLANLYKSNDRFGEANWALEQFFTFDKLRPKQIEKGERLKKEIAFVKQAKIDSLPIKIERLPNTINTLASEYLPAFTADGQTIYYTQRNGNNEDLFIAQIENDSFHLGIPLDSLNTPENEGAHCITPDGQYLFFTGCGFKHGFGSCDIYITRFVNGDWIDPVNMGEKINSSAWESQPSLSPDGKRLFFSSERNGGIGGRDIWVADFSNGKWQTPVNLGPTINTTADESTPFIHHDNKTLYFRSDGHIGMGKNDLFFSKQNQDSWSTPINLGYPINTKGEEGALAVSTDGKYAYFASDEGNLENDLDIFRFELPESLKPEPVSYVKILVKDALSLAPIIAKLTIQDLATDIEYAKVISNESGLLLTTLPAGKNFSIYVEKKDYIFYSENFTSIDTGTVMKPVEVEVLLQKIPKIELVEESKESKPVILNNIFFETGSAVLKQASNFELNKLIKVLENNANANIRILGHTDDVGDPASNLALSKQRAESVSQYLITNGIAKERISALGKGETQPIDTNETEEGKKNNRRVEFVLFSK